MANPTDHGPLTPDPSGRPDPDRLPADDDSQADFALPDLADLKDFGLSDPGRLSGVNLAAEGSAGSDDDWLPPLPDEPVPGSNAEFDLPPVPDDGSLFDAAPPAGASDPDGSLFDAAPSDLGSSDDGSAAGDPTRAAALHVEPAFEAEDAPLAELLPAAEPESPEEAAAEDPSAADLFAPVEPGTGWFDSQAEGDLASDDDLPLAAADEADLGGTPDLTAESSNILSGLTEPAGGRPGDSSNVRLEGPGFGGTLADADDPLAGPASGVRLDATDADAAPLPPEFHTAPGPFARTPTPTEPQFDLPPADDIFAAAADMPNLAGATSSIFTGLPAVTGQTDPADLGDDLDVSDAVEFSDHPDARSADSDSLHVPPELRASAPDEVDPTPAEGLFAAGAADAAAAAATPARSRPRPPSDPAMVVDYVADEDDRTAERPAARADRAKPAKQPRDRDPVRRPPEPGPVNKGAVGGVFLGLLLGGGVVAGLNYSGVVDIKPQTKPTAGVTTPGAGGAQPGGPAQPGPAVAAVDPKAVLAAGDPAGAVRAWEKGGATTPADKAALGEARVLAWLRAPADPAGLKQAQDDLKAAAEAKGPDVEAAAARAALYLGLTHELAGDRAKAKGVYEDGRAKFVGSAALFDAALDRLKATDPDGGKTSRALPAGAAELLVLAAFGLVADEVPAPRAEEPAEAGPLFWKAVNAATAGKYDDAVKLIGDAKAAHEKRAKALAGKGLNPLSDPLEQIFPRSCDDLKAYWELRRTVYNHPTAGALAQKEGIAKALDQLTTAEKRATDAVKAAAELKSLNDKLAADAKGAGEKVAAAEKELKAARELATKWKGETEAAMAAARKETEAAKAEAKKAADAVAEARTAAQKELDKRTADLKAAQAEAKTAADSLEAAKVEQKRAADALAAAKAEQKTTTESLAAVAKVLREAKLLDDKADPAAVLAAAKLAAARAAGTPDAVAAEMKELSARAAKAEEAVKAAAAEREKLAAGYKAEVEKLRTAEAALKEKQADALKKLADDRRDTVMKLQKEHADEVKKVRESVADARKEVRDEADKQIAKLQAGHLAATKELGEKYAATEKKVREQAAADLKTAQDGLEAERKKLFDTYTADVKKLTGDVEAAQKKAADAEALAKKIADDAKEATKKIADAEAMAKKAAESEAATKKGAEALALRVKDANQKAADTREKLAEAERAAKKLAADAEALAAQRLKAEELAKKLADDLKAEKERAADLAKLLAAAPAGGGGVPAAVSRDAAASAARSLDAGITAYKAARYEEAERALGTATAANPADAVGWYFLGAARWSLGRADAAREAFKRGAGAEAARLVPARVVDAAVGPIQGPARDALAAERP